ncbi:MAG: hypothetical protein WC310_02020 [Patescibacteria group bacterium]|jgi:hypothetical protein
MPQYYLQILERQLEHLIKLGLTKDLKVSNNQFWEKISKLRTTAIDAGDGDDMAVKVLLVVPHVILPIDVQLGKILVPELKAHFDIRREVFLKKISQLRSQLAYAKEKNLPGVEILSKRLVLENNRLDAVQVRMRSGTVASGLINKLVAGDQSELYLIFNVNIDTEPTTLRCQKVRELAEHKLRPLRPIEVVSLALHYPDKFNQGHIDLLEEPGHYFFNGDGYGPRLITPYADTPWRKGFVTAYCRL